MFQQPQVVRKNSNGGNRCRKTGKIKYDSATAALDTLAKWLQRDPDACWDLKRFRIYKCDSCHQFHLGRYHG